jgi:hypothetical protein
MHIDNAEILFLIAKKADKRRERAALGCGLGAHLRHIQPMDMT